MSTMSLTTVPLDDRTFRLRLPVLRLGRVRASVVVHVTERIELRLDRHPGRGARRSSGASTAAAVDVAVAAAAARAEAHRTAALAHRPAF